MYDNPSGQLHQRSITSAFNYNRTYSSSQLMIPSSMAGCVAEMMEIATPSLAECGVRHRVGDPSSLRTPAPVILS